MLRVLNVAFPDEQDVWTIAVAVLACVSLAWGNIAALVQRRVKRLLAYSSISHAGFMLIAIAAANELGGRALLFYLIPYSRDLGRRLRGRRRARARARRAGHARQPRRLRLGAPAARRRDVHLHARLRRSSRSPAASWASSYVFSAASEAGWNWLVIVGVVATLVSLYYYLAVIRAMYMRPAAELRPGADRRLAAARDHAAPARSSSRWW